MTKDLFFENSFKHVKETDKKILTITSYFFITIPGVYGILSGYTFIGVISMVSGLVSILHWSSTPMTETKHLLDLFCARTTATICLGWIIYYCINLPIIYSYNALYISAFSIAFYVASVYFGNIENNWFWIIFHFLFHFCCFITLMYLYTLADLH
jgi:hypothetical protein